MYSDGHEVDGSWVLRVYVTDLQVERSLRVKGELHIGGVMLRLVEDLGEYSTKSHISLSLYISPLFTFFFLPHFLSSRYLPTSTLKYNRWTLIFLAFVFECVHDTCRCVEQVEFELVGSARRQLQF